MKAPETIIPFSNGTEASSWYEANCGDCTKAFLPKDGEYPSDKTMKHYCRIGKECRYKYAIDYSFMSGELDKQLAEEMGFGSPAGACIFFSDDRDDRYKPPKRPRPDNTPGNQVLLFSDFDGLVNAPIRKTSQQTTNYMKTVITTIAILLIAGCTSSPKPAQQPTIELEDPETAIDLQQEEIDRHLKKAAEFQERGMPNESQAELYAADSLLRVSEAAFNESQR